MRRRGMSMLEIVVAMLILGIGMTVIFEGLSAGRDQIGRLDVLLCGRWLCQSVMDQVVHDSHNSDMRFFKLDSPPEVFLLGNTSGAWKKPFEKLARKRTPVLLEGGKPGPFFDPATGPAWPSRFDAAELAFWRGFSYEVRVGFTGARAPGFEGLPLDSDGDGMAEMDLAHIEAEVFWKPEDGSAPERTVCHLTTLIGAQDKAPGSSALVEVPPDYGGPVEGAPAGGGGADATK